MSDKQIIREKAAAFLDEIRNGVADIIQQPGKGFDFGSYVSKWDEENSCGTVCCMEGWIPAIRPDLARYNANEQWFGENPIDNAAELVCVVDGRSTNSPFLPKSNGIPISDLLWSALTIPGCQDAISEMAVRSDATFNEIVDLWNQTADRIRTGDLDYLLIFE